MSESTPWGVITAQHQRFAAVSDSLASYGVEFLIPMMEKVSVVRGRHVRELKPMLGEYILISITEVWKSLLRIRGVTGILLNENGMPAQVLSHELNWLRTACKIANDPKDDSEFEYGQRVTPKDKMNAFAFHVGKYDSTNKRGNQAALFLLFGREQRVWFKPGELITA